MLSKQQKLLYTKGKGNRTISRCAKEEIMKIGWNVIALLLVLGVTVAFYAMILWIAKKYLNRRK